MGVETLTALADKGYFTGEELKKCKEENLNAVVCPTDSRNQDGYGKDAFLYEEKEEAENELLELYEKQEELALLAEE